MTIREDETLKTDTVVLGNFFQILQNNTLSSFNRIRFYYFEGKTFGNKVLLLFLLILLVKYTL